MLRVVSKTNDRKQIRASISLRRRRVGDVRAAQESSSVLTNNFSAKMYVTERVTPKIITVHLFYC